jgi:hypothetical protein
VHQVDAASTSAVADRTFSSSSTSNTAVDASAAQARSSIEPGRRIAATTS